MKYSRAELQSMARIVLEDRLQKGERSFILILKLCQTWQRSPDYVLAWLEWMADDKQELADDSRNLYRA